MPLSRSRRAWTAPARRSIQGTTISSFDVHVIDVVQDPQHGSADPDQRLRPGGRPHRHRGGLLRLAGLLPRRAGEMRNAGAISEASATTATSRARDADRADARRARHPAVLGAAPRRRASAPLLGPLMIGVSRRAAARPAAAPVTRPEATILAAPAGAAASFRSSRWCRARRWPSAIRPGDHAGRDRHGHLRDGRTCTRSATRSTAPAALAVLQDAYVYDVISNPNAATRATSSPLRATRSGR